MELRRSLRALIQRIAPTLDLENSHQMNDACEYVLQSFGHKRRADAEDELIAVAKARADLNVADMDHVRLTRLGFELLVTTAQDKLKGNSDRDVEAP